MLINRRKVKEFALEMSKHRAHKFTRVGSVAFLAFSVGFLQLVSGLTGKAGGAVEW